MGQVISFGDSFCVGLGTDIKHESRLTGGQPDWQTMSDDEKNKRRREANLFRRQNSFTAF